MKNEEFFLMKNDERRIFYSFLIPRVLSAANSSFFILHSLFLLLAHIRHHFPIHAVDTLARHISAEVVIAVHHGQQVGMCAVECSHHVGHWVALAQHCGRLCHQLPSFKIKVYDEDTGYGLFRHVLIRRGFSTGQIMVVLVTASPVFPSKNNFVRALLKEHPEITTIVQNVNGRHTSMVLGSKENVLYGKGYIEDTLCGCTFRISSKSFYQINPVQTEKLYSKAIELADLKGTENVLDAYCGIGTIGLIAASHCKQVAGVELNADAVKDAMSNRNRNKVENARFFQGDASEFMVKLAEDGQKLDVVFMDPPRSGSTEQFIDAVATVKAKRVVYISCNPETLARDLKYFEKKGYVADEVWPVDMFPWTDSIEAVTVLERT